jgi:arylsulfatase A-like enzyme
MAIKTYKDGTPFTGVIGRTTEESSPAWPEPPRPPEGAPNVLFFVLDDVGYGQLSSFGGLVETPVLDSLAANGLRYTNVHTTALCSPSRGCILTGRNHHSIGLASITETSTGYPGYNGVLPFDRGMISEMLVQKGYNTFCIGKWHLTPPEHTTPAGPYDRWPLGRGFERYYGFLGGETHQWYPELTYDNHEVEQPKSPEEGYHLSIDLADKAIEFIQDSQVNAPDKPFFLYYATGAGHAPHHVPKEWADKYKGKFDMGWDKYREIVHQRQLEMGIIPPGTELSTHDPDVPVWDTLPAPAQQLFARMMEVYAGFMSFTDHHFGRIIDFLREIGELDNTLIMVISDNGASSEGGPVGSLNEMFFFNNVKESLEDNLKMIDKLGGVDTQPLCLGLDQCWQHTLPPLEARDLPGWHHRSVHRFVAQGHPGARRDPFALRPYHRLCPNSFRSPGDRGTGEYSRRDPGADRWDQLCPHFQQGICAQQPPHPVL